MMTWENELAGLLSISKKSGPSDLAEEQLGRHLANDEPIDAMALGNLNIDALSVEIKRRIQGFGGGEILSFRPKDWMIRLAMDMGAFKRFKKKAFADPVLKHFEFTHRKKKKGGA